MQFQAEHPGTKLTFNFAGSQQLAQQLSQGAPADVFASADPQKMQSAIQAGRVAGDSEKVLLHNRLVIIFPKSNQAGIQSLRDLAKPGVKLVLAAKEVPAGLYSLDFLTKASQDPDLGSGYRQAVLQNVVSYEENVRAVLSKVVLGEADAGIVYTSDAQTAGQGKLGELQIPDNLNVTATYMIAPVLDSQNPELASEFINYTLSNAGQSILKQNGFIPVP